MVWSPEAEAEWKEGLLRNTATREDALEEYYCVPKNGGGTYIPAHCVNVRPVAPGKCCALPAHRNLTH